MNSVCHPDRPHCAKGLCNACYQKKYFKENTVRVKARMKISKRTLRSRFASLKDSAKRGSRNLCVEISFEEYTSIVRNSKCFYCSGDLPETGGGLDRKDNRKGYTKENVVPCCHSCNNLKSDKLSFEEMVWIMSRRKSLGILCGEKTSNGRTFWVLPREQK